MLYISVIFEHFLTLLKEWNFIIGNSRSRIREAWVYGKYTIDIGNRQKGRYDESMQNITHPEEGYKSILSCIKKYINLKILSIYHFREGNSYEKFLDIISKNEIWNSDIQKKFIYIFFLVQIKIKV